MIKWGGTWRRNKLGSELQGDYFHAWPYLNTYYFSNSLITNRQFFEYTHKIERNCLCNVFKTGIMKLYHVYYESLYISIYVRTRTVSNMHRNKMWVSCILLFLVVFLVYLRLSLFCCVFIMLRLLSRLVVPVLVLGYQGYTDDC